MEEEPCIENGVKKIVVSKTKCAHVQMEGPDGGWAWIVAFSACTISCIMAGLGRMSGILYVVFIESFGVDRKAASMPFAVRSSAKDLFSPIVGILGQKYGVRIITIIGGFLATASGAMCFFAPDIIWITVLWGVLNGIGAALTVTLTQVVIAQYFSKHMTTASGLAFSGGCIGAFLFPVLLEQLLLHYGMQGTFLILGAIIMHTIPAAMILRKPPWLKNSERNDEANFKNSLTQNYVEDKSSHMNEEIEKVISQNGDLQNDGTIKNCSDNFPDIHFLKQNQELVLYILTTQIPRDNFHLEINPNESLPLSDIYIKQLKDIYSYLENYRKNYYFHQNLKLSRLRLYCDILEVKDDNKSTYQNKSQSFRVGKCLDFETSDIKKTNSMPDIITNTLNQNSVMMKLKCINEASSGILCTFSQERKVIATKAIQELQKLYEAYILLHRSEKKKLEKTQTSVFKEAMSSLETIAIKEDLHSNTFITHIITAIKLYKNPLYLLLSLCRAIHLITFLSVITSVVDFIMDKGLVEADGKYAMAAISLGDLLGRLGLGWITDRGYLTVPRFILITMLIQGVCNASLALINSKATLFIMLAVFSMLQGAVFIHHNVLVSRYLEHHEQSIAMGCINAFAGLIGLALPAYIGYFRDTIGSYDYIMYINGTIAILVGLLWSLVPYFLPKTEDKADSTDI